MQTRRKIVAGNWKMHGSLSANRSLLTSLAKAVPGLGCEVVVCVPFPYLASASDLLAGCSGSGLRLGAQNLSEHAQGAYTGEVSAAMLLEFACRYVIVGHSERRALYGETDLQVAAKCSAALEAGLVPILCVGETLLEREAGGTVDVVSRQLTVVLEKLGVANFANMIVAYEPVWAIGTGKTATPAEAELVHCAIRSLVAGYSLEVAQGLSILYGGSVKPQNAAELFAQPDIDGGLIGGASLVSEDFLAICRAAN